MSVLEIETIDVCYGASQVLFGLSLAVEQGQTMALLGRNGAGKSTTMKAVAGFLPKRAGRVRFAGQDVTSAAPYVLARLGLAYVPEDRQVFPEHTVQDNLLIAAKRGPGGEDRWDIPRIWRTLPLLERLKNRLAGRLSGGEQQMLAIGRALMGNPTMLLLDEPSEGLAPIVVTAIGALLRELRDGGATVLIAEQNMHFCLGVASDAVVIGKGGIVYRDNAAGLRANAEIRSRYLAM